jgi:membrane-associated phospholipid phosphatase
MSARTRAWRAAWLTTGLVLVAVGFLGLDRWFYEHVSLVLESKNRWGDRDFYAMSKPFWLACRYAFGYGAAGLAVFIVLVVWNPARWQRPTAALLAAVLTALAANVAQGAIGRLRPNQASSHLAFTRPFEELFSKQRVSFPSAEAATAFAVACVLGQLRPRSRAVFYPGAGLAAVARLINGAHYLSDVAAGALFGELLARYLFRWLDGRLRRVPAGVG